MTVLYQPQYGYLDHAFQKGMGVLCEDGKIKETGTLELLAQKYPEAKREVWDNLVMTAGTVNVHNHCFQSLLRGLSCDRPFLEWRDEALYRFSPRLTREDIYRGAVFAFSEMMKCGVTTVSDFFYMHTYGRESDEMIVKAAQDVGIRLVLARTMYDWDGAPAGYVEDVATATENTRELMKKYNGTGDQMVTVLPAPHSLHAASTEMVLAGHQLAREMGCCYHIHVAEEPFEVEQVMREHDGMTPIEYLDHIGVVDDSMVIVHGVWLKQAEIELLGRKGGKLAYCPSSNMFLADGITNLVDMKKSGVLIGLGTDGACSNNRISVFEEMRMAALLQKASTLNAMCLNYEDAFRMGTEDGGKLLGLPVGEIKAGNYADFVGVRTDVMSMQPISDSGEQILPNLVYSMQPDAIARVVVNGETTMQDGKLLRISEPEVLEMVQQTMHSIGA